MAFRDSHYKPEYQVGYNWQHYWGGEDLKVGLGYTVFLFARADMLNYTPLPAILPLASLRYSRFEVMGTFVPGFGNANGNIAFFFGRLDF
jgi:palmitoyl transferase